MRSALCLMMILAGVTVRSETMYVYQGNAVGGRAEVNQAIRGWSDLALWPLFGMNRLADRDIASLDRDKAYRCVIDGTKTTFNVNSLPYSSSATVYKTYGIAGCAEVKPGEVLKAARDQDEVDHPPRN